MQDSDVVTIPHAVRRAAMRFGAAAAVVEPDGRRLSFHDLAAEMARASGAFAAAGIVKGDRIAIWAPNSAGWIVACIGAQAAGAVVVTLNTRLKGAEAQYILNKSRARILVTIGDFLGTDYAALLHGLDLPHLELTLTLDRDWAGFLGRGGPAASARARKVEATLTGSDPSDILFTSGTTGQPKGVVCGHGQTVQVFQVWADRVGLRQGDRYLIVNPFFHTFGYKAGWLACILAGATAYPMATLDVPALVRLVKHEQITVLPGPPTIFQSLLAADVGRDLGSLRLSVTGAASVPPSLIERMRHELGIDTVLTGYGLTESTGTVSLSEAGDSAERVVTTCGKPIPGIEVRCIDGAGNPVPTGAEGEVVVRGFNVMQGYFEDEAATRAAIDAEGWLHTGDIGRFDTEGYLQITDRLKDMYISGGFNCYPAEIERIMAGHPEIAQVAVIGVPDERLGEVGKAFVVPRPGKTPTPEALIAWCRENMANYKAPRQIELRASLPLNAAGKVQKFELRMA
jgi:acyl-CoA synthetase (AMP-forming)/AMP-acid ligase II